MQFDLLQKPVGYRPPSDIRILMGCEKSGVGRRAFERLGFDVFSCDLQKSDDNSNRHYQDDVRNILNDFDWDVLILCHPPCTRTCNSGVRWLSSPPKGKTLEDMQRELKEGCELFSTCWNADVPHIGIEQPIMHKYAKRLIKNYKPQSQVIQPHLFGDKFFKATCWHLKRLPNLVPTNRLELPEKGTDEYKAWSMVHRAPPSKERSNIRSRTFPGHAKAFTSQWGRYLCNHSVKVVH